MLPFFVIILQAIISRKFMKNGFTLIELLIVSTLISIILGVVFISNSGVLFETNIGKQTKGIETALRKAQVIAISGQENNNVGVKIMENKYIIFKGNSYADRISPLDKTFNFPAEIAVLTINEVVFESITGLPIVPTISPGENINIMLKSGKKYREININSEGKIESNL